MSSLPGETVFYQTIYAEARGEGTGGQRRVAWVIKTRARKNYGYWGGASIKDVCLHPGQFECWNGYRDSKSGIPIDRNDADVYKAICEWGYEIYHAKDNVKTPYALADHYNNPSIEGPLDKDGKFKDGSFRPKLNVRKVEEYGNHWFYISN